MQTINPAMVRPDSRARRRRLVVAACIAIVLLTGLGVMLWLNHRVPSPDADAGRLSRYMASPAFAALPHAQKAPYMQAFQRASDRGELTPEQQRGVISNIDSASANNPLDQYYFMSPVERAKFLDDVIDRADRAGEPPRPADKVTAKKPTDDSENEHLADAVSPEDRARMDQFMQDLHNRRVARGLPDNGRFLLPLRR